LPSPSTSWTAIAFIGAICAAMGSVVTLNPFAPSLRSRTLSKVSAS
jgi:hypothetical protein